MTKIAVIGTGTMGTAIAHHLGVQNNDVVMWSFDQGVPEGIASNHKNPTYLSDIELPNVSAYYDFADVVPGAECIVVVCPSPFMRSTVEKFAQFVENDTPIIVLSKGVEANTGFTMAEVITDVLGNSSRVAVLTGPNHAEEIARDMYGCTVVAAEDKKIAKYFQDVFMSPNLRVYTSTDVMGVELCSSAKNILAIANGMLCKLEMGDNASAALMTRGVAEIARLVTALGGDWRTCMGLTGMGDIIVTCTSVHSRNRTLGEMLVEGKTLADFEAKTKMVAEGAIACKTVTELARKKGIDMPICEAVYSIMYENANTDDVIKKLFERPSKSEF